ncbi:MAG TPA: hypothetical protein VGT08_15980 [Terracidiphilus sp.]|nr:hypothetical protein [Terracidiphilus sp.]
MTLIKKRDVKRHFAARRRARTHPFIPASQPDATGFSGPAPDAIPLNPAGFVKDFLGDHSVPVEPIAPSSKEGLGAL